MDPSRGLLRLARAGGFAAVSVPLSLLLHQVAHGAGPGTLHYILSLAIASAAAYLLSARSRGLPTLVASSCVLQVGLHLVFTLSAHGHGHAAAVLADASSDGTMMAAHTLAGLSQAWWLHCGERAVERLAVALLLFLATVRSFARPPMEVPRLPAPISRPLPVSPAVALLSHVRRRGPPRFG
ncbi:hypothetical protein [Salininema proteolyticum]|uniref:Uncharacterized protein n=1 Tax=Salininema proteolyticum TaxID=1607685 RepID=A0ABV8TVE8_9ACTN